MKILTVSESDTIGGAAYAAYRLHNALNKADVSSTLLVSRKLSHDNKVISPKSFLSKFIAKVRPHYFIWLSRKKLRSGKLSFFFRTSTNFVLKFIKKSNYDITHLHWVNHGFFSIQDLNKINTPIIWTLHDTWMFTSACHSTQGCLAFKNKCQLCPKTNVLGQKNVEVQFYEKLKALRNINRRVTFTVPSDWMLHNSMGSTLLKDFNIIKIPNIIDTKTFINRGKQESKIHLGLDSSAKYFVFGASDPLGDKNKGFEYVEAILRDEIFDEYTCIVFGKISDDQKRNYEKCIFLGEIKSDDTLAEIYSLAEVLLVPSIHESFGQVAAEAMSCGVPVLCFDTTGLKDIVEHKLTGYLAEVGNVDDLKSGLQWILLNQQSKDMSLACRNKILGSFSADIVCQQFLNLYRENVESPEPY